ncbi:Uncharacterised protein [Vibrio cholerae]|nr:Uncharacterised protein [Vibrio cholerae]
MLHKSYLHFFSRSHGEQVRFSLECHAVTVKFRRAPVPPHCEYWRMVR